MTPSLWHPLALVPLLGFGLALTPGCGADVNLVDQAAGGAGGAGSASTATTSDTSSTATSSTVGSGGGTFCPGLVVGGEAAIVSSGGPNRLALTEGSADGQTSILAYGNGTDLRLVAFAPWNQWPEPLPAAQPSLSAQGGASFAVGGAGGPLLGAVFQEATPGGELLVMTPTIDIASPGAATRFPLPLGQRALAVSVRDDGNERQVLGVFEEETVAPDGGPAVVTRHAVYAPSTGLTTWLDGVGCSAGPEWASAFPVDLGFRLVTLAAPTSDGCPSPSYATAIRAVIMDPTGDTIALSYLDRGFPIDQAALAPNDEGALIVHSAIMNALSPIWLIDWQEATGTFGEPVALSAPQFQGWGPLAAARVGPVFAVAYIEMQDPASGRPRVGLDIVSDKKATAHLDIEAADLVDGLALLGSPYGTALVLAYSTLGGEIRALRIDCVGAL